MDIKRNNKSKRASPTKIAYYVQRMCIENSNSARVILAIKYHFDKRDLKEFATRFQNCVNSDKVRHVADMISRIPYKSLNEVMERNL